jgi:hypothetical protein
MLNTLNPDEVLQDDFIREYGSAMQFFHLQLVHLNADVYILDHVLEFPFRIFLPAGRSLFFRYVFENFFYASLLIVTRLATDQGSEFFTLPRFKNKVRQAVKAEYREEFDGLLRSVKFDKNVQLLLDKAAALRSMRVAHSTEEFVLGDAEEPLIRFGELKALRDNLVRLFTAFTFNADHVMEPLQYSARTQIGGAMQKSDIEELLELVAGNSTGLRLPETDPRRWEMLKSSLVDRELRAFNHFRRAFDLPEA